MNPYVNAPHYLSAFLGGVLVSFTPCIFPLIPISVGYIGVRSSGSKIKGFILGFIYVTGMAITYAALGVMASFTGTLFGKISALPVTNICVGSVIFIFGLSMLDLFTVHMPRIFDPHKHKQHDYISTFILGLSSGFLASPCLTPVVGSILAYLATKHNPFYGGMLLLCFAYGMGLILILADTFSAAVLDFFKSSKWMVTIKRIYAFILLGAGIYFIIEGIRRI